MFVFPRALLEAKSHTPRRRIVWWKQRFRDPGGWAAGSRDDVRTPAANLRSQLLSFSVRRARQTDDDAVPPEQSLR